MTITSSFISLPFREQRYGDIIKIRFTPVSYRQDQIMNILGWIAWLCYYCNTLNVGMTVEESCRTHTSVSALMKRSLQPSAIARHKRAAPFQDISGRWSARRSDYSERMAHP